MKPNVKRRGNIALHFAAVLFCLVMITTWMTGGLLAKYTSTDSGNSDARVAAFVFRVDEQITSFVIPVNDYTAGSDAREYRFTVTNQTENGLICETDQEYTITMQLDGSLPLVCTLLKEEVSSEGTDNVQEAQIDALQVDTLPSEKSCNGNFEAAVVGSETYILQIEWPIEQARMLPEFAGGVAEVEIQITSVQTD